MNLPPVHPHLMQLAAAHGFTIEALMANRARQIHPSQAARGKGKGIGFAVFLFIMAGLFLIGGLGGSAFFYSELRAPISDVDMNAVYAIAGGGVVLAIAATAGAISTLRHIGQRRGAYQQGALEVVEGPIMKVHIRGRQGIPDTFRYDIAGRSFNFVPREGWELVYSGAPYRVYSVAGDLLSLEPIA